MGKRNVRKKGMAHLGDTMKGVFIVIFISLGSWFVVNAIADLSGDGLSPLIKLGIGVSIITASVFFGWKKAK